MHQGGRQHRRAVRVAVLAAIAALTIAIVGPASALAAPSSVLAWGDNSEGQLGDGTLTGPEECSVFAGSSGLKRDPCSTLPVPVGGLNGVTSWRPANQLRHYRAPGA